MENIVQIWQKLLEIIKPDMQPVSFSTWIETIIPVEITGDKIILEVPYEYTREMIKSRYADLIKNALRIITGNDYFLDIRTKQENMNYVRPIEEKPQTGMNLNPAYTFETFVIGKSNQIAHAVAKNLAQSIQENRVCDYNPLFLHGGVGLGKTHLMHAICHQVLSTKPNTKIMYTTSEQFTNELINAIKDDRNQEFRDKYRTVDILLIDDIQFIGGRESTQEEFFHTFNALYQNNKHIVITSDRPPKELYTLEDRLKTRFECGGIFDINPPDFETRIAILKKKADQIGIEIPDEIYKYIAEKITSNIRDLEGSIKMIMSYHKLMNKEITLSLAEEALKDYNTVNKKNITLPMIASNVERYCNLKENELKSADKSKRIAYPRQIAMYLMKELTDSSLVQIGEFFGGKDHSTVLHGINKIRKDIESNPSSKTLVDNIISDIKN